MIDIYNYLKEDIENLDHKISKLKGEITTLTKLRNKINKMMNDIKPDNLCRTCNGKGKVLVWYAQDDSKIEECKSCKGMGIIK